MRSQPSKLGWMAKGLVLRPADLDVRLVGLDVDKNHLLGRHRVGAGESAAAAATVCGLSSSGGLQSSGCWIVASTSAAANKIAPAKSREMREVICSIRVISVGVIPSF